ncbi:MAG: hypothetical protein ACK46L_13670 [Synechococcaceae cyanobacterium]
MVVELASTSGASPSDAGPRGTAALRQKMALDHANGARLGWLLLPHERAVEIWRAGLPVVAERLENASRLEGGRAGRRPGVGSGGDLGGVRAVQRPSHPLAPWLSWRCRRPPGRRR